MQNFLEGSFSKKFYLPPKGIAFVTKEKNLKKRYTQVNGNIALCQKRNQQFNWHGDFIQVQKKDIKKYDEFIQFSLAACEQAFVQSGLTINEKKIAERSGCIIGSGIGGLPGIEKNVINFHSNNSKVSPFFITGRLINMAAGFASIKYNLQGTNYSTVSACASGAHAIGESLRLIQRGEADVMVTGGSEATICPIGIEGFTSCRALSTNFNDDPGHH